MKILHYIDKIEKNSLLNDYLDDLICIQKRNAEVCFITAESQAEKMIEAFKPDIVHLHTCWSQDAYKCFKAARKRDCAMLLSPHWQFSSYILRQERNLETMLKTLIYQKSIVRKVDALMVNNNIELEELNQLRWNERIDIVKMYHLSHDTTPEEMAEQTQKIYEKILITRYRKRLTNKELQYIGYLTYVGLTQEEPIQKLSGEDLLALRELTPSQWKKILLFADDENIRDYLDIGTQKMQLNLPSIQTSDIVRYNLRCTKATKSLVKRQCTDPVYVGNTKMEPLIDQIADMLNNAKTLLKKRKLSLLHLTELYLKLRYNDYNEDHLSRYLQSKKLHAFARRMMSILQMLFKLEDGFTPIMPLADTQSKTILERIINRSDIV